MKSIYMLRREGTMRPVIADVQWNPLDNRWHIHRINVPEPIRGKGYGSQMLRMICRDADEEGVSLQLVPSSSGGLNQLALEDWYRRYGFVGPDDWNGLMVREPQ